MNRFLLSSAASLGAFAVSAAAQIAPSMYTSFLRAGPPPGSDRPNNRESTGEEVEQNVENLCLTCERLKPSLVELWNGRK